MGKKLQCPACGKRALTSARSAYPFRLRKCEECDFQLSTVEVSLSEVSGLELAQRCDRLLKIADRLEQRLSILDSLLLPRQPGDPPPILSQSGLSQSGTE